MESWKQKLFRELPKVDEMLDWPEVLAGAKGYPRWALLDAVRETLDRRRERLVGISDPAADSGGDRPDLAGQALALLIERGGARLRPVINASGIIVHTNLGRSPLAREALEQIEKVARGYSNLEYTLDQGERGSRQDHCEALLRRLTGAEAALAVNNNAAAVFLCLNSLAEGREVVVSRGQDAVAAGADLVGFSGDKLLGAPQAGLIVGRRDLIERVRKNPLHRAMRIDKLTLAASRPRCASASRRPVAPRAYPRCGCSPPRGRRPSARPQRACTGSSRRPTPPRARWSREHLPGRGRLAPRRADPHRPPRTRGGRTPRPPPRRRAAPRAVRGDRPGAGRAAARRPADRRRRRGRGLSPRPSPRGASGLEGA